MKELDDVSDIDKIIDPTKIEVLDIGVITANNELLIELSINKFTEIFVVLIKLLNIWNKNWIIKTNKNK